MIARRASAGFTLLEMLLVILLAGVLLSLVSLATGAGPATQARAHGQALLEQLHSARQSALLESTDYGLRVSMGSTQLVRREGAGWRELERPQALSEGFGWRLKSAGLDVALSEHTSAPQILLLSSDKLTPFTLVLEDARQPWLSISSDGLADPVLDES